MYLASKTEMQSDRQNLVIKKMKLDRFFSLYLDKFGGKMDSDKTNTPIWKLYKQKMNEYATIERDIKVLDYRIASC